MAGNIELKNRIAKMTGPLKPEQMMLKNARIREGLSEITEMTVEFISSDRAIKIEDIVGKPIKLELEPARKFIGVCISVEFVGEYQGMPLFVAEVRSWLWFLTRARKNRIYQNMKAPDIIKEIFGDYGFSSNVTEQLSADYKARVYCAQYNETDYDFVCRLMAEEGIYFFSTDEGQSGSLVLVDDLGQHGSISGDSLDFHYREEGFRRATDHIFEWNEVSKVTTGIVKLIDYDFEKPTADQKRVSAITKGNHGHNEYEGHHYPTRSLDVDEGERFARVRMESHAAKAAIMRGMGNASEIKTGVQFTLKEHPSAKLNQEYLVTRAVHYLEVEIDYEDENGRIGVSIADSRVEQNDMFNDTYRCEFEVIPSNVQYRAPFTVPWPSIAGVQTAKVTGKDGEEIDVDQHGRIKVKFFWDRSDTKNELTSCRVRCAMPWTGNNWGMIAIPRIDQEVIIQFEDGNPDRPLCTGMLYNADTMPPYALPDNATQSGIKTRSTKSGSADTFNELVFEDKKDKEFVRLQSEKDYVEIIKNNATITIGLEKKDKGDLTQTIQRNKTETLKTGDHTFTVEDGKQVIKVKKDHTETIEGKATQTITGDTKQEILDGNVKHTVKKGNEDVKIEKGNYKIKASAGMVDIEAAKSITLKVGGSSIKIDPSGITIKSTMVNIKGSAMVEVKGGMATVDGGGMLTLKGGLTMIN